jgi:hypothetical protein
MQGHFKWKYNIPGDYARIHRLPVKHAAICKHVSQLHGLARGVSVQNIHPTRVTETCLFPDEYQNTTHLETDITASQATNLYKI